MKNLLIILLFACLFNYCLAQKKPIPILERTVKINASNEPIASVLAEISNQAGFIFSYSPEAIQSNNKITVNIDQKPVRYALNLIFTDDVSYKVKGKYLILKGKRPSKKGQDITKFEGYVYDSKTGEKITGASIYDKDLLASAVTDNYGYFKMEIPANKPLTAIHVSKIGYMDTVINSQANAKHLKTIEVMMNSQDPNQRMVKQVLNKIQFSIPRWLIPRKTKIHTANLSDSFFRKVQFSLIPFISTNRFLGGNVVNDISVNLTIGYNKGVKKMEFGGIVNIDRYDVSYGQFGGVGNIVGGTIKGFQGAGAFNFAMEKANIQIAGVLNRAAEANLQIAGVVNSSATSNIQISGVLNLAKEAKQLQISGVLNHSENTRTLQISGVINNAGNYAGQQYAGVVNNADSAIFQIAGCYNNANQVVNVQISGVVNKACYVKGLQLGVINIADTCTGVPVGLFNFVRDGYHRLEISADEIFQTNLAFRSGVKHLYSIFSAGISYKKTNNTLWSFGYGLGTSFGNMNRLLFDIDVSAHQLLNGSNLQFGNNIYKINLGIDRRIGRKISIAAGLSYNFFVSDTRKISYNEIYSEIAPYTITNKTNDDGYNHKTWIGGKVALRFF